MKLARYYNYPVANPVNGFSPFFFDIANRLVSGFDRATTPALFDGTEMYEDDDHYYARIEMPGVKKDDLKLNLNGDQMELEAHTSEENSDHRWSHSFTVPEGIDSDKVGAKLEDGILTVTLPKVEERKPRAINVK